jgi:hypothetical protein
LDRVLRYTDHGKFPASRKTGDKWPHRIPTGGCCENRSGVAHTLRGRCGIVDGGVDLDVCAQIFRTLFLFASTPDGDSPESHVPRKLDTRMPKATNPRHGDQLATAQAGVMNCVRCLR